MILEGNQRGGAKNLALHLLKEENDHVDVHELRGFISDNLVSALNESYAVSRGTRAKKFLFSLSLNPPKSENVSTKDFVEAIGRVEVELGLTGQPRAIVFHEKQGRRHCHTVWSRIDTEVMKAIHLSHTKLKLMDISRDLYMHHGWKMPKGFIRGAERDPNNFTLVEWQQAKRIGKDPRAIKATIRDCWAASDTQGSFQTALKEQGYILAQGKRGPVAVDANCEVFSITRAVGVRIKEIRARVKDENALPSFEEAKTQIAKEMISRLLELQKSREIAVNRRLSAIEEQLQLLTQQHKSKREQLSSQQEQRWKIETLDRQNRFNKGLRGFIDRLTGKRSRIAKQNKQETKQAETRDQTEKDALVFEHLSQSRKLRARTQRLEDFGKKKQHSISDDLTQYREIRQKRQDAFDYNQRPSHPHNKPSLER